MAVQVDKTPEQIKEITDKLAEVWMKYPHMRLGQLMINLNVTGSALFYVKDAPLIAEMDYHLNGGDFEGRSCCRISN